MTDTIYRSDDWLAESMGRRCYALSLDASVIARGPASLLDPIRDAPAFVYAKIATDDIAAIKFLQAAGFYLVDCAVTFHKAVAPGSWSPEAERSHPIRLATPDDESGVVDVAHKSFGRSRFHLDPAVPAGVSDELRVRWVQNFFAGKRGEAMVVAVDGDRVVGFNQLLARGNAYVIDLIAVDPDHRKMGIAGDLIRFGDHHFADAAEVRVSTQVANVTACRLYERMGFVLASAQYVFHLHA